MSFETPLPPYNASDPHAAFLNASCLDFLLIELVPMAYRLAAELADSDEKPDDEEHNDVAYRRLETLGYRVGQGLVERFSRDRPRFTDTLDVIKFVCKDLWTLVFRKQIDNLKTNHRVRNIPLCRFPAQRLTYADWGEKGVYVLTDNLFQPFRRMSTEAGGPAVSRARPFLWFPCGLIRGALANMNINATVHAETLELPGATFQIKTITTKA